MTVTKMHGLGNDFVVLDAREAPLFDVPAATQRLCDRRFGLGADGILLVLPSEVADWRMRYLNHDGSEGEMCGNGIRCFARYLREQGLEARDTFTVETLAGIIVPRLVAHDAACSQVAVDMGPPRLHAEAIPFTGGDESPIVEAPLAVGPNTVAVTAVSMGNPHAVIFVDDAEAAPVDTLGPLLERHPAFPQGANVEFVQVRARDDLVMRVWERGAGRTLACGTGACASLVAANLAGHADRRATLHLEGGDLDIAWREDDRVIMTGPAVTVYHAELVAELVPELGAVG